ncbi:LOW QUALITY PROTEIN: inverted formin-2-like [Paramacrobiotus metropolitanus]|uniref:LOW QUALITY PROTEIN: inverted formin-2-like n=1 Tax=Paramacrobiotus metropolitanus TaxID=2943436 RepID=UPI0024458D21|nr:LOW QUALITY PROTEIN: inverted formin-2-like [Paramacrobiotus metropolitanus]
MAARTSAFDYWKRKADNRQSYAPVLDQNPAKREWQIRTAASRLTPISSSVSGSRLTLLNSAQPASSGVCTPAHSTTSSALFESLEPDQVIATLHRSPTNGNVFTALRKKLASKNPKDKWIDAFCKADGVHFLMDTWKTSRDKPLQKLSDAYFQRECMECLKVAMESPVTLDYIIEDVESQQKLLIALDSSNAAVKKQAMDLLSSLCGHNQEGYQKVLDTFERYKAEKNDGSRFQLLVDELRQAKTSAYKTTLIALINAIICNNEALRSRIRIRNEFLALKVHDVLAQIRSDANPDDADLFVQLDTFDEQKFADDANLSSPDGLDLTNVMDVFHAVLAQVANTPQEATFLNLLQHLLQVDPNVPLGNTVWSTAEKLVHRASLLETKEDADLLLRPPVNVNVLHNKVERLKSQHDLTSPSASSMHLPSSDPPVPAADTAPVSARRSPPPPPPPPPMGGAMPPVGAGAPPPPPPPVPGSFDSTKGHKAPPAPPKAPLAQNSLPSVLEDDSVLPQQNVPKPTTRLKPFNWNKIPVYKVVGRDNLWTKTTSGRSASIDFGAMEKLFAAPHAETEKVKDVTTEIERKRKDSNEINLLDSKRSLNVNIFLKQFRTSHESVIEAIKTGKWEDKNGAEKLLGLMRLLPESDETDMLRNYEGSISRLGAAEKFLLRLVQIPNYKLRIEAMLFHSEYPATDDYLRSCVDLVIETAVDIKASARLHETLHMVLLAGNFLNTGGYAGNAAGFKLSSLLKLVDLRSNKPSMNLMHCIAEQAALTNPLLLNFPDDMDHLHQAIDVSTETLMMDIRAICSKCQRLTEQLETADAEVKEKMLPFLENARKDLSELNERALEMERLRVEMAEFFCEDVTAFNLQDCFKILHAFCQKFRKAVQENEQRKVQEEKAESRRLEEQEKRMRRQAAGELSDSAIDSSRSSWNTMSRHLSERNGSTSDNESGSVFRRDSMLDNGYASDTGAKKRARRMIRSSDEDDLMEYLTQGAETPSARSSARPLLGELLPSFGRHSLRSRPARSHDASIDSRERATSSATNVVVQNGGPQNIEEWLQANESMNGSLSGSQMRLAQIKSAPTFRTGNLPAQNTAPGGSNAGQNANGLKSQLEQPAPVVSPVRSQQPFQPNPIGYESTGRGIGSQTAAKPGGAVNGKWNPDSGDQKTQAIQQPRPWAPSQTLANKMHVFDPKAGCPGEPLGSGTASPASSSSENVQPMGGRSGEETDTDTLNGSEKGRKQLSSAASQRLRKWRRLPATNGKSIDEEVLTDTSLDDAPRSTGLSVRNQNPYDSARKQTRTLREMRESKRNTETPSARRAASFGPTDRVRRVRDVPKSDSEDVPNGVATPVKTPTTGISVFDRLSAPKRSSPPLERSTAISPGNGTRKSSVPLLNGKRRGSGTGKNSDDNGSDDAKSCVTSKSHNSDGSSASTNSSASRATNRTTTRVTLSSRTPASSMTRPGDLNISGRTRSGAQKNPDGTFTTRVTDYTLQSPESPKVVKAALVLSAPATSRMRH